MDTLKFANASLGFVLELCMLAALGYWGFQGEKSLLLKWLLGLGAPLAAACVWGLWLAPQATYRLNLAAGTAVSLVLFGLATLALYNAGQTTLAIVFGTIVVINQVLLLVWQQW